MRHFSERPVPLEIVEDCLIAASTAPNGANSRPWQFVVVSEAKVKHEIRIVAEVPMLQKKPFNDIAVFI